MLSFIIFLCSDKTFITPQNGEESPPPEKERADQEDTEKSHTSPVPHCAGPNDDLYAIPVKLRPKKEAQLPPGWEKHEGKSKK